MTRDGRGHEDFKTGTFQKDYYSDAFSFSKDHDNAEAYGHEGGQQRPALDRRAPANDEASSELAAMNSFQMMKQKNQASMSSAQIIKYHNFVSKRAKKVFISILKGYSPV
jgi:hypothetical protein